MVSKLALEYLEVEADTLEFMVKSTTVRWPGPVPVPNHHPFTTWYGALVLACCDWYLLYIIAKHLHFGLSRGH